MALGAFRAYGSVCLGIITRGDTLPLYHLRETSQELDHASREEGCKTHDRCFVSGASQSSRPQTGVGAAPERDCGICMQAPEVTSPGAPSAFNAHEKARYVVDELYRRTLKAMEEELTVKNYEGRIARIERYKQIHKNRI